MRQKIIVAFLVLGCVVSAVLGLFLLTAQDGKAPEIQIEKKEISYIEGEEYDKLLQGVSAKDNIDGDLTDQVFVDRIVPYEEGKAVVYYGVMDAQNNVGTGKRVVDYTPVESGKEQKEEAQVTDVESAEQQIQESSEEEKDQEKSEDVETDEKLEADGENPAISLVKKKVTIKAGDAFHVLDMVKEVVDDKDDASTLYQYIHADGQYDTKKKGTYKITYYVTDSDKNVSEKQVLTLVVE